MSDGESPVATDMLRSPDSRYCATARPDECPAVHGGMAGYWLCELPRGHQGGHRDTEEDGRVWVWRGMEEIESCIPENNEGLSGRYEDVDPS